MKRKKNNVHEKQWKNAKLFLLQISIVILNTVLFAVTWYLYYKGKMWGTTFYRKGDYVLFLLYMCLFGAMAKLYGGIALRTSRITELIYSQIVSIIITNAMMYIIILLLTRRPKSILPLLLVTVIECFVSTAWSYAANHLCNKIFKPANILLVYDNEDAYKNAKEIIEKLAWRFKLSGELRLSVRNDGLNSDNENITKFIETYKKVGADSVMLCGLVSSKRNDLIKYCVENDIKAFVRPNIGDFMISNAQVVQMANMAKFYNKLSITRLSKLTLKLYANNTLENIRKLLFNTDTTRTIEEVLEAIGKDSGNYTTIQLEEALDMYDQYGLKNEKTWFAIAKGYLTDNPETEQNEKILNLLNEKLNEKKIEKGNAAELLNMIYYNTSSDELQKQVVKVTVERKVVLQFKKLLSADEKTEYDKKRKKML